MKRGTGYEPQVRKVLALLLAIALLGFGIIYWMSDNLGELAADAISHYGSTMTRARVGVEHVDIHPSTGKGVISGLFIGNPKGFKTPHALSVQSIEIDVDLASVASDVIVVRMILISKPDVIYEKGESLTNFDAIQRNIEAYLGPANKRASRSGPRLIVNELTIANATAYASAPFMEGKSVSIPLPDISLRNLGADKGGVTPGELGEEIAGALKARLSPAANFKRMTNSAEAALDKAGLAIKSLFK